MRFRKAHASRIQLLSNSRGTPPVAIQSLTALCSQISSILLDGGATTSTYPLLCSFKQILSIHMKARPAHQNNKIKELIATTENLENLAVILVCRPATRASIPEWLAHHKEFCVLASELVAIAKIEFGAIVDKLIAEIEGEVQDVEEEEVDDVDWGFEEVDDGVEGEVEGHESGCEDNVRVPTPLILENTNFHSSLVSSSRNP
jgi:hypothetical protein